jgi:hypothetical protein
MQIQGNSEVRRFVGFVKNNHYWFVGILLSLMLSLGLGSMVKDSAIVDEVAHIPAGYSYLHYGDFRLNPEHPPLIKALAALPLQFMHLAFPLSDPSWTKDVNGQWESGWHFLYHDGNNAERVLFWSRLPILLLSVGFAAVFYEILRRRYGVAVALLAVFFYALEPNILAHSRLVTTDIGVTAFVFLSIYSFVRFLEKPNFSTGTMAAILLGLAQLSKFSAVLLAPLYIGLVLIAVITWDSFDTWKKRLRIYGLGLLWIGLGALLMVWLIYIPLTLNMPSEVQKRLVDGSLNGGPGRAIGLVLVDLNHIPGVKAITQYVTGVLMVLGRVKGGNTTYFLGQVSNQSFAWFFPITYLIKTPLALLIMIFASIVAAVMGYLKKSPTRFWSNFKLFSQQHFLRLAAILYVAVYAYTSITGNLNLGIRHLLSMFPFIFLLVAYVIARVWRKVNGRSYWVNLLPGLLLLYYAFANFNIYPSYIAYFNELIGGPDNAYKYEADSSVDWGQDLKRLKEYVIKNKIEHIAVDYFGGGEPRYYFCDRKYDQKNQLIVSVEEGYDCSHSAYQEWHAQNGLTRGYMAVSETYLMNDLYYAPRRGDKGYEQLRQMKPVAKIGHSIYVYYLP